MGRLPLIIQGSLSFPEISFPSDVKASVLGASFSAFTLVSLSELVGKLSGRIEKL